MLGWSTLPTTFSSSNKWTLQLIHITYNRTLTLSSTGSNPKVSPQTIPIRLNFYPSLAPRSLLGHQSWPSHPPMQIGELPWSYMYNLHKPYLVRANVTCWAQTNHHPKRAKLRYYYRLVAQQSIYYLPSILLLCFQSKSIVHDLQVSIIWKLWWYSRTMLHLCTLCGEGNVLDCKEPQWQMLCYSTWRYQGCDVQIVWRSPWSGTQTGIQEVVFHGYL